MFCVCLISGSTTATGRRWSKLCLCENENLSDMLNGFVVDGRLLLNVYVFGVL